MPAPKDSLQSVCSLDDLPPGGARGFIVGSGRHRAAIFLVRQQDHVYGYINRCPHTGVMLDWVPDQFLNADNDRIICSTHGALFNIQNGKCVSGPCAGDHLTTVPVTVDAGQVMVETRDLKVEPPK